MIRVTCASNCLNDDDENNKKNNEEKEWLESLRSMLGGFGGSSSCGLIAWSLRQHFLHVLLQDQRRKNGLLSLHLQLEWP